MNTEQKRGILQPITGEDFQHSYEEFTQRPFYKEVNRRTLNLAPRYRMAVLDIATGTGGMVELMLENGDILNKTGSIIPVITGIDIDENALLAAEKKFKNEQLVDIEFRYGSAEKSGAPDFAYDLVTFCNAIHLTDVQESFAESLRVLEPGGTLVVNTAFVDGVGYPTSEAADLWSSLGRGAIRKAMRAGHRPTESPKNYFKYTREQYEQMVKEAGFQDVETSEIHTLMDIDDVLAICHYDEFAAGALPGVPLEVAHKVLEDTAREIYAKLVEEGKPLVFPRGWMLMNAVKPLFKTET